MQNVVEHMNANSLLLLSTPCGVELKLKPEWEHHEIEYSAAHLYDFLSRYFETILRPEGLNLPCIEVFDLLRGSGIKYLLKMNPVVCKNPIKLSNPYQGFSDSFQDWSRQILYAQSIRRKYGILFILRSTRDYVQRYLKPQ